MICPSHMFTCFQLIQREWFVVVRSCQDDSLSFIWFDNKKQTTWQSSASCGVGSQANPEQASRRAKWATRFLFGWTGWRLTNAKWIQVDIKLYVRRQKNFDDRWCFYCDLATFLKKLLPSNPNGIPETSIQNRILRGSCRASSQRRAKLQALKAEPKATSQAPSPSEVQGRSSAKSSKMIRKN